MSTLGKYLVLGGFSLLVLIGIVRCGVNSEEAAARETAQRQAARAEEQQAAADRERKEWAALVAKKQIVAGMPTDYVRRAWGEPSNINRTTTGAKVTELWTYGDGRAHLVFEGSILQTIQENR